MSQLLCLLEDPGSVMRSIRVGVDDARFSIRHSEL